MSHTELIMARRQIEALIRSDPIEISLRRREKVETPGGGWRWGEDDTLDPQTVTLIPFKRRLTEFLVSTEIGDVPDLPYIIVGYPNLDVQKEDTFQWEGDTFIVKTLDIKVDVRVSAQVDYVGGEKNG